jgi:hypothetical protein
MFLWFHSGILHQWRNATRLVVRWPSLALCRMATGNLMKRTAFLDPFHSEKACSLQRAVGDFIDGFRPSTRILVFPQTPHRCFFDSLKRRTDRCCSARRRPSLTSSQPPSELDENLLLFLPSRCVCLIASTCCLEGARRCRLLQPAVFVYLALLAQEEEEEMEQQHEGSARQQDAVSCIIQTTLPAGVLGIQQPFKSPRGNQPKK